MKSIIRLSAVVLPLVAMSHLAKGQTMSRSYDVLLEEYRKISVVPDTMVTDPISVSKGEAQEMAAPPVLDTSFNRINTKLKLAAKKLREKVSGLNAYTSANGFNTEYCFLVDMSIPSGKRRFFVYNIAKDSIEYSSLVSHGSGSYFNGCDDRLIFSNMPNSNATSLGKYRIGNSYYGNYGLSYKLFGLDSTNSNAFDRAIVLHSDAYVPETETYPRHIFQSAGCPCVSPAFLAVLDKYLKQSSKPVLLWIYN